MTYYNAKQTMMYNGIFVGYINGGYMFHLENDDIIDFDQINTKILEEYNLKIDEYRNQHFEIVYSENFDDLDDEDVVIFKLEELKLL